MANLVTRASQSLQRRWTRAKSDARIRRLNRDIAKCAAVRQKALPADTRPVVFFNASTRLTGLSLNAAYSLVTRWAVAMAGVRVVNFVCDSGMARCVLGTKRDDPHALPPCSACTRQSRVIHAYSREVPLRFAAYPELQKAVEGLSVPELETFQFKAMPIGALVLPSMRWILRRHHLRDDAATRFLFGQYIFSAWHLSQEFARLLDETTPQAVVVFNGMFYPEAAARWVAWQRGLRVISHEVGLRPFTAYFTPGDATAYPIHIPEEFELSPAQNQRLDEYLEKRMQGNFTMAGVRFWPEMRGLDASFLDRAVSFRQVVPVFTNVIFDTSQPHSNVVFPHMFAWLDLIVDLARAHPDTLFVIRAHPDEARPGKESRESVADWVRQKDVCALPNVIFVEPQQYFSSYELIQRSKFVMVYNSTIGLEAALMGAPVLCGGRARFTQLPIVSFPQSPEEYRRKAETFLMADKIDVPAVFKRNARRFLYYQLYRTSLPFDEFLEEDGVWQGYVRIKDLEYTAFDPLNSPADQSREANRPRGADRSRILKIIVDGILNDQEFLLDE